MQSPILRQQILTKTPAELDAWLEQALTYPGTPLALDRDPDPGLTLQDFAAEDTQVGTLLHQTCLRCVKQLCEGRVMAPGVAEDLLLLIMVWGLGDLGPVLVATLQAQPVHPTRLRLRMLQCLAQFAALPADFWLPFLSCEGGELSVAAFHGLLKADPKAALAKLASLQLPKLQAAAVPIIMEQFFEDHPEHRGLLEYLDIASCDPRIRSALGEWLAEVVCYGWA